MAQSLNDLLTHVEEETIWRMVESTWSKGQEVVQFNPIGQKQDLHFKILYEHEYSIISRETCESLCYGDVVEYAEDMETTSCAICLEEFSGGCEALLRRMPCSHVFPGDCIKEWVSIGHNCPVCRYETPIRLMHTNVK